MFGGGGFGGDAGNQFAGGGFMPSQAHDTGYGGGGGSGGGRGGKAVQTLRTLTIRQLAKDLANADDEQYIVDGAPVANLTVLGKITNVVDRNSSLLVTLADGTGELDVLHWLSDEELVNQSTRAELRPGVYVKAHGHLKPNEKNKGVVLNAFTVRPVTNFNELTYHYLRTIFEHLHITRGGAGMGGQGGGMAQAAGGFGGAPAAGGWQQQPAAQQAPANFAGAAGVDPCQTAVLSIIQASNAEQGVNQTEVYNRLGGQFGQMAIDAALQSLMTDAHIYNTVDDNHWKAA